MGRGSGLLAAALARGATDFASTLASQYMQGEQKKEARDWETRMQEARQKEARSNAELERAWKKTDTAEAQQNAFSTTHTGENGESIPVKAVNERLGLLASAKKATDDGLNEIATTQQKSAKMAEDEKLIKELGGEPTSKEEIARAQAEEEAAFDKGLIAAEKESKVSGSVRNIKEEAEKEKDKDRVETRLATAATRKEELEFRAKESREKGEADRALRKEIADQNAELRREIAANRTPADAKAEERELKEARTIRSRLLAQQAKGVELTDEQQEDLDTANEVLGKEKKTPMGGHFSGPDKTNPPGSGMVATGANNPAAGKRPPLSAFRK